MKKLFTLAAASVLLLAGCAQDTERVELLEDKVQTLGSQATSLMNRNADLASENEMLIQDITALEAKLEELEAELEKHKTRADELQSASDEAQEQAALEAEAAALLPATEFTGGTYIVGDDIEPGTYRTDGGEYCYYAWMTSTGSDANIIDNHLGGGPQIITLADGEIFESERCGTWIKQ